MSDPTPSPPREGTLWLNSDDGVLYRWSGAAWEPISSAEAAYARESAARFSPHSDGRPCAGAHVFETAHGFACCSACGGLITANTPAPPDPATGPGPGAAPAEAPSAADSEPPAQAQAPTHSDDAGRMPLSDLIPVMSRLLRKNLAAMYQDDERPMPPRKCPNCLRAVPASRVTCSRCGIRPGGP